MNTLQLQFLERGELGKLRAACVGHRGIQKGQCVQSGERGEVRRTSIANILARHGIEPSPEPTILR